MTYPQEGKKVPKRFKLEKKNSRSKKELHLPNLPEETGEKMRQGIWGGGRKT